MKQLMALQLVPLFLMLLTSCSNDRNGAFATFPVLEDHRMITDPKERWKAYNLTSYVIEQRHFSAWSFQDTIRIYVVDNKKALVTIPSRNDTLNPNWHVGLSVDELFAMIDTINAHLDPRDYFAVAYDPRYGFPSQVAFATNRLSDSDFKYDTWHLLKLFH